VKKVLRDATYRTDLIPEWQAAIYKESLSRLTQMKGTFKYIGNVARCDLVRRKHAVKIHCTYTFAVNSDKHHHGVCGRWSPHLVH
jgi:hypothetical protein